MFESVRATSTECNTVNVPQKGGNLNWTDLGWRGKHWNSSGSLLETSIKAFPTCLAKSDLYGRQAARRVKSTGKHYPNWKYRDSSISISCLVTTTTLRTCFLFFDFLEKERETSMCCSTYARSVDSCVCLHWANKCPTFGVWGWHCTNGTAQPGPSEGRAVWSTGTYSFQVLEYSLYLE